MKRTIWVKSFLIIALVIFLAACFSVTDQNANVGSKTLFSKNHKYWKFPDENANAVANLRIRDSLIKEAKRRGFTGIKNKLEDIEILADDNWEFFESNSEDYEKVIKLTCFMVPRGTKEFVPMRAYIDISIERALGNKGPVYEMYGNAWHVIIFENIGFFPGSSPESEEEKIAYGKYVQEIARNKKRRGEQL